MLEAMRQIALDFLASEETDENEPESLYEWFVDYKEKNPGRIFRYLIEDIGKIEKYYTISVDPRKEDLTHLSVSELTREKHYLFPFIKPSGSQSGQLGPVIKRTYSKNNPGPSSKIIKTTYSDWEKIGENNDDVGSYFKNILNVLSRQKINILDKEILEWKENYNTMLDCVIEAIGPEKSTVLLTIKDSKGRYPGEVVAYGSYLSKLLVSSKYETTSTRGTIHNCTLCRRKDVKVYPNGIKGAGINFGNVDREGAFFGLNINNAWKSYAICSNCADLLYIYKNHAIVKQPFQTNVAGDKALLVPFFSKNSNRKFMKRIKDIVDESEKSTETVERRLWGLLSREESILNLNIYWVNIGQNIEELQGSVTDITPSRLRDLSIFNKGAKKWENAVFPKVKINNQFQIDLSMNFLQDLFKRPGGKKNKNYNKSKILFKLKREIAASIYHKRKIQDRRFWKEMMKTAELYLMEAVQKGDAWSLLNEGQSKKGENFVTFAGWIRHLAWFLYYLKKLEVISMEKKAYIPNSELLKPFFTEKTGIDTEEKAFSFILGILYGRLLKIQGAKGINVGSNALTWLKRLTIKGSDLPGLYIKTREKLLAYEAENNEQVREIIRELGVIGAKLGDAIDLDTIPTNYFLLLGQSVSNEIISKKEKENNNDRTD